MTEETHLGAFSYEALVSLNNTGALLLQRNQFEEAYLTYLDALHVLEHGKSTEEEARGVEADYECSLKAMVACAAIRLEERSMQSSLDPYRVFAVNNYPAAGVSNTCRNAVSTTATAAAAAAASDVTNETTPLDTVYRIIRQESIYLNPLCLQCNPLHVDLITAVITYNFGLVHLKLSTVNESEALYFRQTGERLMKYAYAAIPPPPPCTNYEDFKSIVTITSIVLSFLIDVCFLTAEETRVFSEDLRLATEGLSFFGASSNTAPAA